MASDRVLMVAPTGRGTAKVAKTRVTEFEANGWRVAQARKPARAARKAPAVKAPTGDEK